MKSLLCAVVLVLVATAAAAQTVLPTARVAADYASSAATAQALTWRTYPDGLTVPVTVAPVTCVDMPLGSTCTLPLPAFADGPHSLAVSVFDGVAESGLSNTIMFLVAAAQAPGLSGTLLWQANPAAELVTAYTVTLNGTIVGTTTGTSQPITFTSTGPQTLTVFATNATGPGPAAMLVYTVAVPLAPPTMPTGVRVTVP
jgi:hypothetical protein